jgi:hypothetical protein
MLVRVVLEVRGRYCGLCARSCPDPELLLRVIAMVRGSPRGQRSCCGCSRNQLNGIEHNSSQDTLVRKRSASPAALPRDVVVVVVRTRVQFNGSLQSKFSVGEMRNFGENHACLHSHLIRI